MDIVFPNVRNFPKNCAYCFAMHTIQGSNDTIRCLCYAVDDVNDHDNLIGDYTEKEVCMGDISTPLWCPAIKLEDHGRVIDIDALPLYDELFMNGKNDSGVWVRYKEIEKLLKNAPTLLSASEFPDPAPTEREKALRMLRKCGILDENNNIKGPYKEILKNKE